MIPIDPKTKEGGSTLIEKNKPVHPDDAIYAYYGSAVFAAQILESGLIVALVHKGILESFEDCLQENADKFQVRCSNSFSKMTMGKLISEFENQYCLSISKSRKLRHALSLRNELAHGYFLRNASRLQSASNKAMMVRELEKMAKVLIEARDMVDEVAIPEQSTVEKIQKEIEQLLKAQLPQ